MPCIHPAVRRLTLAALISVLPAGCVNLEVGGRSTRPNLSYFDLGSRAPDDSSRDSEPPAVGLRSVDVIAPTWLDAPAMQYRLAYSDPARRASYAESRWAAPPPELLQLSLRRSVSSSETRFVSSACRLQIEVDEFIQVFDSLQSSRGVIELRATLLLGYADTLLARKTFRASRPAPSADARGGVVALAAATNDVSVAIRGWLDGLSANSANGVAIVPRCRAS